MNHTDQPRFVVTRAAPQPIFGQPPRRSELLPRALFSLPKPSLTLDNKLTTKQDFNSYLTILKKKNILTLKPKNYY